MIAFHLLLLYVSSKIIKFPKEKNYTKDELLEKVIAMRKESYGNDFFHLISTTCEITIRYKYPNIRIYSCAYYTYVCNQLTPATRNFAYNETIEIEDFQTLNGQCLDCKTLNYFQKYIELPKDDC